MHFLNLNLTSSNTESRLRRVCVRVIKTTLLYSRKMNRFSTLTKSRLEEDRDRIELVRSTLMRHGTLMVSNDLFELISTTLKNHDAAKDDIIVPMVNDADDPMHSNDNRNRVSATAASTFSRKCSQQ